MPLPFLRPGFVLGAKGRVHGGEVVAGGGAVGHVQGGEWHSPHRGGCVGGQGGHCPSCTHKMEVQGVGCMPLLLQYKNRVWIEGAEEGKEGVYSSTSPLFTCNFLYLFI